MFNVQLVLRQYLVYRYCYFLYSFCWNLLASATFLY